jgi:hypothetical protein
MRTWMQIASISTGTPKVADGIQRLADGSWDNAMKDGFEKGIGDVEHSAEPSADTLPGMMLLRYGDPLYVERNMQSAKTIKERFMGIDEKGYPRFISTEFGADGVNTHTRAGGDTGYHARAMKHFIWLGWWGNPEAKDWFVRWADGWRAATMAQTDTKPPGLPPSTIWYPSGDIFPPVEGVPWWDEKWNYYGSLGLGNKVHDSLLAAYYLSGDPKFLKPFQTLMDEATRGPLREGAAPGTKEWCCQAMVHWADPDRTSLYKWLTGERAYDEYTLRGGEPAQKYRVDYDLAAYHQSFRRTAESLRTNLELQTTEVLSTDRAALSGALTVFGAYTGAVQDLRDASTPTWAVTYETPDENFAAVVTESTPKRLRVWLYSFRDGDTRIGLRVWQLRPGRYVLNQGALLDGEKPNQHRYDWIAPESVRIMHRADTVYVNVPPHRTWVADLRLDTPIAVRKAAPDLAVAPRDLERRADGLRVTVHNIGNAGSKPCTVALQKGNGDRWTTVAEETVRAIPAPKDFVPSTAGVILPFGTPEASTAYRVVLDPDDRQYELCETNNAREVP